MEALAREGRGKTLCFIIEKDAMVWYNIEKRQLKTQLP